MPVPQFVNKVLISNLAFTLIEEIWTEDPDLEVSISSIQTDLLQLSVKPMGDFDMALFASSVDEMTADLAVDYTSLHSNNIGRVFSNLVQQRQ